MYMYVYIESRNSYYNVVSQRVQGIIEIDREKRDDDDR